MNRRSFLKILGLTAPAVCLGLPAARSAALELINEKYLSQTVTSFTTPEFTFSEAGIIRHIEWLSRATGLNVDAHIAERYLCRPLTDNA